MGMETRWQPLAPGELDHELLWLCVSVATFGLAALWLEWGLPVPACPFHEWTGLPCVTCGATRCATHFFRADFAAAWAFNPLAFLALVAVVLFDLYALVVLAARLPRLRVTRVPVPWARRLRIAAVAAIGSNWLYTLSRY